MSKYRIMLLDDQKESIELLQKELIFAGYDDIETFIDADEALERFKNEKFHIVLLDTCIGNSDRIDILKTMKGFDSLTQFIVMSQHSSISKILTCLELGVNDYLTKPFNNMVDVQDAVQMSIRKLERLKMAMKESVYK